MTSFAVVISVLVAAVVVAVVVGRLLGRRDGAVRDVDDSPGGPPDVSLPAGRPAILHFSASWCGPCAGVRRVVDDVCAELPEVAHLEIDLDANPAAARSLSVLSLPTTFIFDGDGRQRYRSSGVPKVADLRSALEPLLA